MLRDYHGMHVTDSNAGRLFKVCLSVVMSVAAIARGAIHTARSPEFKDVQSAVNSANDGDTVIVPGGTDTWSSTLTIRKNITLQGNGVGKTVILDGIPDKWDIGRKGQSNTPLVNVELSKDSPLFRLTGFEFSGAPGRTVKHTVIKLRGGSSSSQNPLVLGCTSNFRLDHCKFNGLIGMPVTFTDLLGVVDHVEYTGKGNFCDVQHPRWGGRDMGHASWADDPYWGTG